jgi:hypothetical protein
VAAASRTTGSKQQRQGAEAVAAVLPEVKRLQQEVNRHRELYYAGTPEVADGVFDGLVEELRQAEAGLAAGVAPPELKGEVEALLKGSPLKQVVSGVCHGHALHQDSVVITTTHAGAPVSAHP